MLSRSSEMTKTKMYRIDTYQAYIYKLLSPLMLDYRHRDPLRGIPMLFKWICSDIQSWTTCYLKGIRSWSIYLRNSAIPPGICYVYNRLYFYVCENDILLELNLKYLISSEHAFDVFHLYAACYSPTRVTFLINHVNLIELHRIRHDTDVLSLLNVVSIFKPLPQITRSLSHSYAKLYFS